MATEPESRAPEAARRPLSLWAVASLLCSLAFLCAPAPVLGILTGLRALVELKARPELRGRRLALAGIGLGVVVTAAWVAAALWWNGAVRRPLLEGPADAIRAAYDGDLEAFEDAFARPGAPGEARAFVQELRRRYGPFLGAQQAVGGPDGGPSGETAAGGSSAAAGSGGGTSGGRSRIGYVLSFGGGRVQAEAEFVVWATGEGFVGRFAWLGVRDPESGDLVYPLAAIADDGSTRP